MCVYSICRKLDRPTKRELNKLETSSGLAYYDYYYYIMHLTFASTFAVYVFHYFKSNCFNYFTPFYHWTIYIVLIMIFINTL